MWKAVGLLVLVVFAVHFYMLARTGHTDPCRAAYTKLEFEALGAFKNGKRWLVEEEGDRAKFYESIERREILQCYKIALF
jgi:hypothetical protein